MKILDEIKLQLTFSSEGLALLRSLAESLIKQKEKHDEQGELLKEQIQTVNELIDKIKVDKDE